MTTHSYWTKKMELEHDLKYYKLCKRRYEDKIRKTKQALEELDQKVKF